MRKKHFFMKKIASFVLAGAMVFSTCPIQAFAAQKLYDQVTTETVTKGVTYEKNHRLTAEGWQDIHVLKIDMNDPNLALAPIESQTEYGLKETLLKMVNDTGAVAAVNSDFFGMKGDYSASFGPVVKDGNLISAGTDKNIGVNEYSTFFIDQEGNPFIDFFHIQADFYAGEHARLELASFNKITEMIYPIYFDKNAADSTADLDKRFADLVKFKVENDTITYISQKGETVDTPENGYLIIISGQYFDELGQYFAVGQPTNLDIKASLDLTKIQTAISGVGRILVDGQKPAQGQEGLVISGRQPRTALGISQDNTTLILMVVDGRGDSIGATQEEMVALMQEYGAYNAMHFDGGGSSTMVAKTVEDAQPEVKNTVSDGAERKIINGFGIFNQAPIGELTQITLKPSAERVFVNNSVTLQVTGYDEYFHTIDLDTSQIVFSVTGGEGVFEGMNFTPTTSGKMQITATYQDKTATTEIESMVVASITAKESEIRLNGDGESAQLHFTAKSTEGYTADINTELFYTISDPALGVINENTFIATTSSGTGYIQAVLADASCSIPVVIGVEETVELPWVPENIELTDKNKATIQYAQDGANYVNIIGKVTSATATPENYTATQSKAKAAVENGANVAIYGGKTDITPGIDAVQWNGSYQFQNKNGVSIVMMTAAEGGLRTTNPTQWLSFKSDIENAGNSAVVIVMDKTPSAFTDPLETLLFRSVLADLKEQGKTIFVVSASGTEYWFNFKDGIRYVTLPDLFLEDGCANTNATILKLRVNGTEVSYETVKIA